MTILPLASIYIKEEKNSLRVSKVPKILKADEEVYDQNQEQVVDYQC
jgi:hypothetical protein